MDNTDDLDNGHNTQATIPFASNVRRQVRQLEEARKTELITNLLFSISQAALQLKSKVVYRQHNSAAIHTVLEKVLVDFRRNSYEAKWRQDGGYVVITIKWGVDDMVMPQDTSLPTIPPPSSFLPVNNNPASLPYKPRNTQQSHYYSSDSDDN